jgi:hypothetical protein
MSQRRIETNFLEKKNQHFFFYLLLKHTHTNICVPEKRRDFYTPRKFESKSQQEAMHIVLKRLHNSSVINHNKLQVKSVTY